MADLVPQQLDWRGMAEAGALILVIVGSTLLAGLTITKLVTVVTQVITGQHEIIRRFIEWKGDEQ